MTRYHVPLGRIMWTLHYNRATKCTACDILLQKCWYVNNNYQQWNSNRSCHSIIWNCYLLKQSLGEFRYFWLQIKIIAHHRLNVSSSTVLMATPRSYRKCQISTLYKITIPERILMKFVTVDYVRKVCHKTKFGDSVPNASIFMLMNDRLLSPLYQRSSDTLCVQRFLPA